MREISIDVLRRRLEYDPITGIVLWKKLPISGAWDTRTKAWNARYAGTRAGYLSRFGVVISLNGEKAIQLRRVAWALYYGKWSTRRIISMDGDPTNLRITNLCPWGRKAETDD